MPPKKRRPSIKRNLLWFAGLTTLVATIVIAASLLNREAILILNEDPAADLARRAAPENAFPLLREAIVALPAPPEPINWGENEWDAWRRVPWRTEQPTLAAQLGMTLPDSDPAFLAYLEACRPVYDKARAAADKPYFLLEKPTAMSPWERNEAGFKPLGLSLVTLGAWHLRDRNEPATGLQILEDTIRLSRLVAQERDARPEDPGVEAEALAELRAYARRTDAAGLAPVQALLDRLGTPYADRVPLIKAQWRMLDNTLSQRISTADLDPERRVALRFLLWYWQDMAEWIIAHKEEVLGLVQGPPPAFHDYLERQDFRWKREERRWGPLYGMWRLIRACATVESQYHGTRIVVALEQYQRANAAYPATLDLLVPSHLAAVPLDAVNGAAYGYRPEGTAYFLYSVGEDGQDNSGNPESDLLLNTPPPA